MGRELLDAARAGRAGDVNRLLEAGAPPNARDRECGDAALYLAASRGRLDVLDFLVGWIPVDEHARNVAGRTQATTTLDALALTEPPPGTSAEGGSNSLQRWT